MSLQRRKNALVYGCDMCGEEFEHDLADCTACDDGRFCAHCLEPENHDCPEADDA